MLVSKADTMLVLFLILFLWFWESKKYICFCTLKIIIHKLILSQYYIFFQYRVENSCIRRELKHPFLPLVDRTTYFSPHWICVLTFVHVCILSNSGFGLVGKWGAMVRNGWVKISLILNTWDTHLKITNTETIEAADFKN